MNCLADHIWLMYNSTVAQAWVHSNAMGTGGCAQLRRVFTSIGSLISKARAGCLPLSIPIRSHGRRP
jgi:hypothetical protein